MFNKNKLLTFAVLMSLLFGTLKANPNHTYGFFVPPTLLAPSNGASNVPFPVQLQWTGSSGTVAIEIYEGCTEGGTPSAPNSIDLGGYQQTAGPITVGGISADLSGVAYNPLTGTLFMITNKSSKITETTLAGGFIRHITLNGFDDPEGIAHIEGYTYAITEERQGRVLYISIYANTSSLNLSNMSYTQLPGISNNEGLEGVTRDPGTGDYYAVKEKNSRRLFRYNGTPTNPNLLPSCDIQINSFGMSDVADIFHLAVPDGLNNLDVDDKMLIISDESNKIVEINNNCNLYSTLYLPTSYSGGATQHEGVTMDNNGTIYVVGEPNLLYTYQNPNLDLNPSNDSGLQGGTLVYSATSGSSSFTVPDGVLAGETEYCWRVRSGNEWSEMWSFTTGTPPGGIVTSRVSTGNDDAEEASNGTMDLNSTDLELVQEGSTQTVGMVFRGLDIPQGATIMEAKLQFATDETSSTATNLVIRGEDTNSAVGFNSVNNNISSRAKTSALVSWQVPAWSSVGQSSSAQRSPDIKSVVQEIVNRNGFSANSNVGIIITGSGKRVAESFDGGGTAQAPKLTVRYTVQECTPEVGTACNDGNSNTYDDMINAACECEGTLCPNIGATCNDGNSNTYNDTINEVCQCEGTHCSNIGASCNDGNSNTYNDTINEVCQCEGTLCPNIGASCNDGNSNTYNDTINEVCQCEGTSCPNVGATCNDGNSNTYNDTINEACQCEGTLCSNVGATCNDGNSNTYNDTINAACQCEGTLCPNIGATCNDANPDTFDDAINAVCVCEGTLCPNIGAPCDDGDPNTYDDTVGADCVCTGSSGLIVESRITDGDDDVEENGRNGNMYLNSSDLELVYDRSYTGNQIIGLRFTNVFLPPGATITKAYVQFTTDEARNQNGNMLIRAEDTNNSTPYINQKYNLSSRPRTQSVVAWTPAAWNTIGESSQAQRTTNIAPVIQELVDRADWAGFGTAITIVIQGGGRRVAESYNGSPQAAPLLRIEYEYSGSNLVNQPDNIAVDEQPEDAEERAEMTAIQNIHLYPNPSTYEINVDIQMNQPTTIQGTITLFDLAGKAHSQTPFDPQTERSVELEVAHLPQGAYIVHVQVGEHTATKKFVKK